MIKLPLLLSTQTWDMQQLSKLCQSGYLSAFKVKNKQGIPELHIIVSFNKPDEAQSAYKER